MCHSPWPSIWSPWIHWAPYRWVSWLTQASPGSPWSKMTNKHFQEEVVHAVGLQPFPSLTPEGSLGSSVGWTPFLKAWQGPTADGKDHLGWLSYFTVLLLQVVLGMIFSLGRARGISSHGSIITKPTNTLLHVRLEAVAEGIEVLSILLHNHKMH